MNQHMTISAQHGEITEACNSRGIGRAELLSMMNLQHANSLATEETSKINSTRFANSLSFLQRSVSQLAAPPPHI